MSQETEPRKRNNRKRKSFLKNARKYAKRGYYGRGSRIDGDTYHYFVRIMEAYKEGFDNDEDKFNFVNNVFDQTVNEEITCSCNQVGCRVIETLLPFASDQVFERFMKAFSEDLRPLCSDRFATHVLEALVTQSFRKIIKSELIEDDDAGKMYKEFAFKVSKFLLNNLEDFIWDTYGNHVIRTCIENLAGIPKDDHKNQLKKVEIKDERDNCDVPEGFKEVVKDYGERLLLWPQFLELCNSELTSGFLQVLLRALKNVDKKLLKKYLKKLINECFVTENEENRNDKANSNILPKAFLSKSVMMLLETSLQVASPKLLTQIYAKCFSGKIAKLAKTRNTNFAVQKLLMHCTEKTEFESMFDELSDNLHEIFEAGHTGVILALGQSCKKLATKQAAYIQSVMKALNCLEPEERQNHIVICLCRFTTFENSQKNPAENLQKEKLNLHGTLILQLMLEFNKPIKLVNSILNMDAVDLKNLFSNTMGSHIVDSFVKSTSVGEKSREKLVRKMKGTYQELASSKYGSRSFENLWNAANFKSKLQIMDELSYKDGAWSNSELGKIISGKVNLLLYKRNKEDWKNNLNKAPNKTEKIFEDILK